MYKKIIIVRRLIKIVYCVKHVNVIRRAQPVPFVIHWVENVLAKQM